MKVCKWNEMSEVERLEILSGSRALSEVEMEGVGLSETVKAVLEDVKRRGDDALRYYTKKFEGRDIREFKLDSLDFSSEEELKADEKEALQIAFDQIASFHQLQKPQRMKLERPGYTLWRDFLSIDRVGLYVPAGNAPLVSTLLMLACPATIAGCQEIVLVTPPNMDGKLDPAIQFAARLCGISEIYLLGGAQAIAAMAYGTKSIKKVLKIFGPGNSFVTEAKRQVSLDPRGCPIDMPAGPSEVLVIADDDANPEFIASDLLAQAEHDPKARCVLVSTSEEIILAVQTAVNQQAPKLSRKSILAASVSSIQWILAEDYKEAIQISNVYAPEHLILHTKDAMELSKQVKNAGSVFIGPWSAEALGDFVSGPNHVLPTAGYARTFGGLGVESFMKSTTFQHIEEMGFPNLARTAHIIGGLERLDGHQASISIRSKALEQMKPNRSQEESIICG
ncbi:MAG: histidinol dehydrogenase [Pseudomonadota bacterium]